MISKFAEWLVYGIFRFTPGSRPGGIIEFFIYDSIKILILIFIMIFVMGVVRTFLPQQKVKKWIQKGGVFGNFFAALFGAFTPFCSCSSIPIFLSFLEAGVPLGICFSFLITSPLINEYLVVLMIGFFGWKITALYCLSGMCIGIVSGLILGRLGLEKHLVKDLIRKHEDIIKDRLYKKFNHRLQFGLSEATSILKKLWPWVLAGVAIGAAIHNFIPQEVIQKVIESTGVFSVPLAVLVGVPMYGSCVAIVPIAVALFQKGIPLGTALAFMMATAALSLPEAVMLRRAMKLALIAIFFGVTTLGIIFTGYLFNFLQKILM